MEMFNRKIWVRNAAVVLVALHNVASYGNPTGDAKESLMVREKLAVAASIPKQTEIDAATPGSNDLETVLEEIIVVGKDEWRLPDLGSSWRAEQEARRKPVRMNWEFLPRYDPEQADRHPNLSRLIKKEQRVGFIELLRFSFGRVS